MKSQFPKVSLGILLALYGVSASATVIKTLQAGATDQSITLKIIDSSTGAPKADVVFNSAGLDLKYWRHGPNSVVSLTEVTQTVNGAHTDGGFVSLGDGLYRLDLPDAAIASGTTAVEVFGAVTGGNVIAGTVELSPPVTTVTNSDKTGYSLVQSFPTNFSSLAITGGGAVTAGTVSDKSGYSVSTLSTGSITETSFATTAGSLDALGISRQGTAAGVSSTTVTLDASSPFATNTIQGATIWVRGSSAGNYWQAGSVSAYDGGTRVATVTFPTGFVTPTGTISYKMWGVAPGSSSGGGGFTPADFWTYAGARTLSAATNITSTGAAIPMSGGRVDSITNAMGTDVITNAALAASAVTEIQSGLATASAVTNLDGDIATVDALATAIKAKTDQLTFGVTNTLNVNLEYQNGIQMCGTGTIVDRFRACP